MTFNIQFENHDSNSNSGDALDLKDRITSKIMLLNRVAIPALFIRYLLTLLGGSTPQRATRTP